MNYMRLLCFGILNPKSALSVTDQKAEHVKKIRIQTTYLKLVLELLKDIEFTTY